MSTDSMERLAFIVSLFFAGGNSVPVDHGLCACGAQTVVDGALRAPRAG